jgi:hypothetical protein
MPAVKSVEGLSRSAIARVKRITWNTVHRWLERAAAQCRRFNDRKMRYDEREQAVNQKAVRVGFVGFWILFVLTNTLIFVLHPQPIPSYSLVGEVMMGVWVMMVGTSMATLWQERADG